MNNELPIEDLSYDFLEEKFAAAPDGNILKGLELRDTVFKKIEADNGVAISDGESNFGLDGEYKVQEYDGIIILVIYSRILDANKTERRAARQKVFLISQAIAGLVLDDPKMNGRVCGARCLTGARSFDTINSKAYAVVNMPIVFNESGEVNFQRRSSY